jgi:hypothetical protein
MRNTICVLILGMITFGWGYFAVPSEAGESYLPMQGKYRMAGRLAFSDIEEGDSHIYFQLSGKAAKTLYESMKVPAQKNECGENGKIKWVENMKCTRSKNGKQYACGFSINVPKQTIELASTC